MRTKLRLKKCRVCPKKYRPRSSFQKVCSSRCAMTWVRLESEKARRREIAEGKRRLRTRSDWTKLAQAAFNAWVKERDKRQPCISCDATEHGTSYHKISGWVASHYRSVGAHPELRFDEANVHKACVRCNSHLCGNIVEYRIRLRHRIGEEELARIEGPHEPKKYTIDELKGILATYKSKLKRLRHENSTEHTRKILTPGRAAGDVVEGRAGQEQPSLMRGRQLTGADHEAGG